MHLSLYVYIDTHTQKYIGKWKNNTGGTSYTVYLYIIHNRRRNITLELYSSYYSIIQLTVILCVFYIYISLFIIVSDMYLPMYSQYVLETSKMCS